MSFVKKQKLTKLSRNFLNLSVIQSDLMEDSSTVYKQFGTERNEKLQRMNMKDFMNKLQTPKYHINLNCTMLVMFLFQSEHFYMFQVTIMREWECLKKQVLFHCIQEKCSSKKIVKNFCLPISGLSKV